MARMRGRNVTWAGWIAETAIIGHVPPSDAISLHSYPIPEGKRLGFIPFPSGVGAAAPSKPFHDGTGSVGLG